MKKHKKAIIILSVVVVIIAAAVAGLMILRSNLQKAPVYPVEQLISGGYNDQSMYGTVYKSDNLNYYLDTDKKVMEVFVKEGDTVKKGDALFKYDTTIMEFDIKEKELDVKMAQITLDKAKATLEELKNTPIVIVTTEAPVTDAPVEETPQESAPDASVPDATEAPAPEVLEPVQEEPQQEETPAAKPFSSETEKQQAINEQQVTVNEAQTALTADNVKLESLKKSLNNATVTSTVDGSVAAIQSPDEVSNDMPFCTIKGDATMTVKGYLSEFDRETTKIGETLFVTDFMSGASSEAEIIKIDDYPSSSGSFMTMGNPNTAYYEVTAVIQDPDAFEVNAYVNMQKTEAAEQQIVIPSEFIRTDDKGNTYVLMDRDGKLVKQAVTTAPSDTPGGVTVTEGLAFGDFIAFPHGDRCKEGALTVESDPWNDGDGLMSLFGG